LSETQPKIEKFYDEADGGPSFPLAIGGNTLPSKKLDVLFRLAELDSLAGVHSGHRNYHPARLIQWAVSYVVGTKAQPWRLAPMPPEVQEKGRIPAAAKHPGAPGLAGLAIVRVSLTEVAIARLKELEGDGKKYGCTTDAERVRWAILRGVLRMHPVALRKAMESLRAPSAPPPPGGTTAPTVTPIPAGAKAASVQKTAKADKAAGP
jgi:hypothetical protein